MAATDLRVHLGEALRRLEHEDIVIETGGVPVALLTRYVPDGERKRSLDEEYARAVSKPVEPGGREKMLAAIAQGWPEGFDADEVIKNIYRWRDEGASTRYYRFNDEGEPYRVDESEVPARQRRVRRRPAAKAEAPKRTTRSNSRRRPGD
ncbi:MAG TPA: hypothetical protein VNM91_01125 [Dehalococcoidia bacterium]|nr:hypothetical protein [Dehalococcoidia bacterium]